MCLALLPEAASGRGSSLWAVVTCTLLAARLASAGCVYWSSTHVYASPAARELARERRVRRRGGLSAHPAQNDRRDRPAGHRDPAAVVPPPGQVTRAGAILHRRGGGHRRVSRRGAASSCSPRTWVASRSLPSTRRSASPITVLYRPPHVRMAEQADPGRTRPRPGEARAGQLERRAPAVQGTEERRVASACCPTRCRARAKAYGWISSVGRPIR